MFNEIVIFFKRLRKNVLFVLKINTFVAKFVIV